MKIRFVRPPSEAYNGYVEGEEAEFPEREARELIGLGFAVAVRDTGSDTRHVSSRTEIVGRGNETQVVVEGRGANIKTIRSPENDKLIQEGLDPADANGDGTVSEEERRAADRIAAEGLVKQEAGRTGGFVDETVEPKVGTDKKATTRKAASTKDAKAAPENK